MEHIHTILATVFGLTIVTNIITEVVKKITWNKIPTNLMVVVIAEVLTLAAGAAYAQFTNVDVSWFHGFGAFVIGLFVAYAAMFGFDKFKQAIEQLNSFESTEDIASDEK